MGDSEHLQAGSAMATAPASPSTNPQINPTLSRKLNKVLEIRTGNEDLLQGLQNLSEFYKTNTLEARRNLRGEIEKRGLEINNEFLDLLMGVQKVEPCNVVPSWAPTHLLSPFQAIG